MPSTIGNRKATDGVLVDDDLNEPTIGEKLGTLYSGDGDIAKRNENDESSLAAKPPLADSVHILLKQALHADDRALLLDCLYTQDEKVCLPVRLTCWLVKNTQMKSPC